MWSDLRCTHLQVKHPVLVLGALFLVRLGVPGFNAGEGEESQSAALEESLSCRRRLGNAGIATFDADITGHREMILTLADLYLIESFW
jgi:hypothetical protein